MIEYFQRNKRFAQVLLFAIAVPALVLTGGQFFNDTARSPDVAVVGSQHITQQQFEAAFSNRLGQAQQMLGSAYDAAQFDTAEQRAVYLESMVNEALIKEAAKDERIEVSDFALSKAIQAGIAANLPKTEDGRIDTAAYQNMVKANGMTVALYESRLREQQAQIILSNSMSSVLGLLPAQSAALKTLLSQTRQIERRVIDLTPYLANVTVTAEQVQMYYAKNPAKFTVTDQSDVEYAIIPVLPENYVITDEDIKLAFGEGTAEQYAKVRADQNQSREVMKKAAAARVSDMSKKLGEELAKNTSDLTALVKTFGARLGSAQNVSRAGEVAPALQNTPLVRAEVREVLLSGEHVTKKTISNPVQADDYTLVVGKVTRQTPGGLQPLEVVKAGIEQMLRTEAAVTAARKDYEGKLSGMSAATSIGPLQTVALVQRNGLDSATVSQVLGVADGAPKLLLSAGSDKIELVRVLGKGAPLDTNNANFDGLLAEWSGVAEQLQLTAYLQVLRARYGVKTYPELIVAAKKETA